MFLVKLKDAYWLGMIRMEGSKVVKGVHKKFMPGDNLEIIAYSLVNRVMDTDVELSVPTNDVVDSRMIHSEACRAKLIRQIPSPVCSSVSSQTCCAIFLIMSG